MKKILKFSFLLSALFSIVACNNDIDGQLNVKQAIQFKNDTEVISLSPGKYSANISRKDKTTARLTFSALNGDKKKVFFKIPKGVLNQPQFKIPAVETGQSYDIEGARNSVEEKGPLRRNQQTCRYTTYEQVCTIDSNGKPVCVTRPVERSGWQTIEYYDVQFTDELWLTFVNKSLKPASFYGKEEGSFRDIVYEGRCY
jgi:hypothetical protein